ncbi:MAG: hypothetical protein EBU27_05425 [Opitutae bacterium]|nr:hypothetical protein [Opitutae bacterium]
MPQSIEPFFENYCFDCHDTDTAKADLDLEGLNRSIVDVADAQNWQDILDQLNSGEMPPKKKAQPGKEELAKVVGDLTEALQSAQAMLKDSGGQIALRFGELFRAGAGGRSNGDALGNAAPGGGQSGSAGCLEVVERENEVLRDPEKGAEGA